MTRLRWDDVADIFGLGDMVLPDARIDGTTVADWQAVLDLVRSRGWAYSYREDGRHLRLPTAEIALAREWTELFVRPTPHFLAIFRFDSPDEIGFDVDLRELQGQERLDELCAFFRALGRRLGKPVVMHFEGTEARMIGYDVALDRVVRLAGPR